MFSEHGLHVSRHCGPWRDDGGNRTRYVIEKCAGEGQGTVTLGWREAREVLHTLLLDMLGGALEESYANGLHDDPAIVSLVWDEPGEGQNRGAP
jgi:hypothetical protein